MEKKVVVPLDEKGRIPLDVAKWIATDVDAAGYSFKDETVEITYEGNIPPSSSLQAPQTFLEKLMGRKTEGK